MLSITILGYGFAHWQILTMSILLSFLITFITIPTVVRVALLKKLFDYPNERTSHLNTVPNLGGLSIFAGFFVSIILFLPAEDSVFLRYFLGAGLLLFFTGLKDDILIIDPLKKLLAQLIATLLIVLLGDVRLIDIHSSIYSGQFSYFTSVLISILLFVALINGFNLIDGVDGLSSGIGILISSFLGSLFISRSEITWAVIAFSFSGSLTAYFIFNVFGKRNKIFMGDTGSMLTGLVISILLIRFLNINWNNQGSSMFFPSPATAFCLVILPVADIARVIILRLRNGKSPFIADKNHIHHSLLNLGYSHFQITLILVGATVFYTLISIFIPEKELFVLLFTSISATLALITLELSKRN